MSGPPPPLGVPWLANVGNNPSINRDPPPPPLDAVPGVQTVPEAAPNPQVQVQYNVPPIQQVVQHHVPAVGVPMIPPPMMGYGMGMGMGLPMPFGPFMGGMHSHGSLGEPRMPWNTPGLMGNPSTRYGATMPGFPHLGFPAGDLPPPPPGVMAGGVVPPFAPFLPLWAGGAAPVGTGFGLMGAGLGMGTGMGFWPGMHRPAPGMITEASGPLQNGVAQGDITQIPGGVPPGVTHVESPEHTIIHVLKGPIYPWLNHGAPMEVEIMQMASTTGISRVIEVCNNNNDSEGWAISECHEMANGIWEKGQTFMHGDAMSCVLTIKDAGWDNKRNRPGGQSLHIYLHRI